MLRAVKLSHFPGVLRSEVCERFGITAAALRRARKELGAAGWLSREELLLGALCEAGTKAGGALGNLEGLAGYLDHVNHDGTTVAEVEAMLRGLAASGRIELDGDRWRLVGEFP
jgi:hypothetical protein